MPPKGSKKAPSDPIPQQTLVLDNGAYSIKAGLISTSAEEPPTYDNCRVIPNCVARSSRDRRVYIASELEKCNDFGEMAFRRPVEKGFIAHWEAEEAIWEHEFFNSRAGLRVRIQV
jgi:actin-related protein 6